MASTKDLEVPEKLIRKLSDLLKSTDLSEIELSSEGFKVKVKAKGESVSYSFPPSLPSAGREAAAPKPAIESAESDLHIIRSPFVGTFYASPSPSAEAYTGEGQSVSKGQVLCIVEAMKIMNEIEADSGGTIEKIYVENGTPVDFNTALFGIRK